MGADSMGKPSCGLLLSWWSASHAIGRLSSRPSGPTLFCGPQIATVFWASEASPQHYTYRRCGVYSDFFMPELGHRNEDHVCQGACAARSRSTHGLPRETRNSGLASRTSEPGGGPSQPGVWEWAVASPKTTGPCPMKRSPASLTAGRINQVSMPTRNGKRHRINTTASVAKTESFQQPSIAIGFNRLFFTAALTL